jgi:hypothetical protein
MEHVIFKGNPEINKSARIVKMGSTSGEALI